ncbi:MAG: hypothetical protein LBT51_09590 [Fusobacteriaceae bacterium]|jgi:hypothetical protein|nr:hypothetical protein [Fusobacteriaceae bacterium]
MDELAKSGSKYSPKDVVMVTKTPEGKLLWLETGNDTSGLKHILGGHEADLAKKGITNISEFIKEMVKSNPVATKISSKGMSAVYLVNGQYYNLVYGTNGYIVSFYPSKII